MDRFARVSNEARLRVDGPAGRDPRPGAPPFAGRQGRGPLPGRGSGRPRSEAERPRRLPGDVRFLSNTSRGATKQEVRRFRRVDPPRSCPIHARSWLSRVPGARDSGGRFWRTTTRIGIWAVRRAPSGPGACIGGTPEARSAPLAPAHPTPTPVPFPGAAVCVDTPWEYRVSRAAGALLGRRSRCYSS